MPQIRKDYVTNGWVVVAPERSTRPDQYKKSVEEPTSSEDCPFCEGNEHLTPPEILAYRNPTTKPNKRGWWIRVIPNKYPALMIEGEVNHRVNHLHTRMNGVGAHEVLIETPDHHQTIATLVEGQVSEIVNAYKDRYIDLTKDRRFKYILIFKNHGLDAGATIYHAHSQIIATPMIPRRIMDELEGARNYYHATGGDCIYDAIIEYELELKERIVLNDNNFVVLSPYAARFPYEVWIIPKRHIPHFELMDDNEKHGFAKVLKWTLKRMYDILGNPPYNYYIHTAPCDRNDYRFYHWHVEITPRLSKSAGFERGTGFYINTVSPEDAATHLRV